MPTTVVCLNKKQDNARPALGVLKGIFAFAVACSFSCFAAAGSLDKEMTFDIPAQPLSKALADFSRQADTNVVATTDITNGKTSRAVNATTTPVRALEIMLEGTKLQYQQGKDGSIVVSQPIAKAADDSQGFLRVAQAGTATAGSNSSGSELGSGEAQKTSGEESAEDKLEEVVVTAQRRKERLLETPISIGVLQGDALDRSSARSVSDVLNLVSGVSVRELMPGSNAITIRGVVPGIGTSTAGYYLDEVPFAFITASELPDANAFDLERVEVLRGPQGTLYGANALSGVVRVLTNDAGLNEFEISGRGRVSDTKHGSNNFAGDLAVNVPLIEGRLAIRGVASYADYSGFISSSLDDGRRINDTTAKTARLKLNFVATDNLDFELSYNRSDIQNGASYQALDGLVSPFKSNRPDNRVLDSVNLTADYQTAIGTLRSSTSYVDYGPESQFSIALTPTFNLDYFNRLAAEAYSQELRFVSALDGPWQFSTGAIYSNVREDVLQAAPDLTPTPYAARTKSESYAIFGEVTRSLNSRWELTGGLRYFDDEQLLSQQSAFFDAPNAAPVTSEFDKVTGRGVITFKPNRDQMLYASVSTGFRSGQAQNFEVSSADPTLPALQPDSILNYEVGNKGSILGGKITYDAAIYYMDWEDIQQNLRSAEQGFIVALNAGTASGLGVDAGITLRPNDRFELTTNVSWNELEFEENILSGTDLLFQRGDRVNLSPNLMASISGSYRMPIGGQGMSLVLSSAYVYQAELILRSLATGILTEDTSGATKSWKAGIDIERNNWSIGLFGDNLLNTENAILPGDPVDALATIRPRPRTIGVQATFKM